jgi:hypothetical protein
MRKAIFAFSLLLASLACAPALSAQDDGAQSTIKPATPSHFYHLKLVLQNLDADGKVVNSRTYSTTISTERGTRDSIRAQTRIPVNTDTQNTKQLTWVDVGSNFDVDRINELDRQLAFHINADITSYVGTAPIGGSTFLEPVTHHNKWESSLLIPIGKPTVIFTSDSFDSKGATQVTATAAPIP